MEPFPVFVSILLAQGQHATDFSELPTSQWSVHAQQPMAFFSSFMMTAFFKW